MHDERLKLDKSKMCSLIKAARIKYGFTQEQMGNYFDLSSVTISRYENGKQEPPLEFLFEVANLGNYDLNELYEDRKGNQKDRFEKQKRIYQKSFDLNDGDFELVENLIDRLTNKK